VRLARESGVRVEAIPGPSAVATAIPWPAWKNRALYFWVFHQLGQKTEIVGFSAWPAIRKTSLLSASRPRIASGRLEELSYYVKQPLLVFRELTKLHEECLQGLPGDIAARLEHPQGEFTLVIPMAEPATDEPVVVSTETLRHELGLLTENDAHSKREAARLVARKFGLSTKFVYDAVRAENSLPSASDKIHVK
jgi:16S rRNA (cytidine1402-2'-O)-methyltransferase